MSDLIPVAAIWDQRVYEEENLGLSSQENSHPASLDTLFTAQPNLSYFFT